MAMTSDDNWLSSEAVGKKNFIFELADAFHLLHKAMNYDIAIACASSLLSAGLYNIRIPTSRGLPSSLDEMNIIVGLSGVVKTIPLKKADQIAKHLGIKLPSFTTTEGIVSYFAETEKNKETGKENYIHKPYGIIINDEMSRKFSEAKRKEYATGCIEAYSSFYDHNLEDTYLASKGHRDPQSPYVTVIGATITNFLPLIPDHFFSQGLAGRFNWIFCDSTNAEYVTDDITNLSDYKEAEELFDKHIKILSKLYAKNPQTPVNITLKSEVTDIFMEFDKECNLEWEYEASTNLWNCNYQYLKRLPEMAIKSAARYSVGRQASYIIAEGFDGITISEEDMQIGISHMKNSKKNFEEIFLLRQAGIEWLHELKKPILERERPFYNAHIVYNAGLMACGGIATTKQWFEKTGISDYKTFEKYKNELVKNGNVVQVDKTTITDKAERYKLRADLSATKIWKAVENTDRWKSSHEHKEYGVIKHKYLGDELEDNEILL